jgi:hypothetical protein
VIALTDVQASLVLFAEAVANEPVHVVPTESLDCWPWHSPVRTDDHIVVPATLEAREDFRSIVLHQLHRDRIPEQSPSLLANELYPVVDDVRSMRVIAELFPGARIGIESLCSRVNEASSDTGRPLPVQVVRSVGLGMRTPDIVERWPDYRRFILAVTAELARLDAASTSQDSLQVAWRIEALWDGSVTGLWIDAVEADDPPTDEAQEHLTDSTLGVGASSDQIDQYEVAETAGGGQVMSQDAEGEMLSSADDGEGITDDGPSAPQTGLDLRALSRRTTASHRAYVYDEWDFHHRQYRPAWCTVHEERLEGTNADLLFEVRQRHRELHTKVRRTLQQLRPQQLVRVHRSRDGEELDIDAAIEAVIDRRSGAPVDDRVSVRRDRAQRSVATAFLVDLSASTSSPAVPPEPAPVDLDAADPMDDPLSYGPIWDTPPPTVPERRVIDVAKEAVVLMGDALNQLGDEFAIYGFSGTGRDGVEFKIAKDFGDSVRQTTWAAVDAMKPLRYTRMGPAIRHTTYKLQRQPAVTKQLIVLSDGYPQDSDYGRDRHDRDYGLHDTAKALSSATAYGIRTFCVTIDPAGHDYLRTMCNDDDYLVIDDVEALPTELAGLYLRKFLRN